MEPFAAEGFIKKWLLNENQTLATYIKESESEDEDLVKGRETLSETLGLWMEYVYQKDDKEHFEEAYGILDNYFLEENGFVHWKLAETGKSEVSTNALVDDLRISHVLFQASEKWHEKKYEDAAIRIGEYIAKYNLYQNVLTDFYDRKYEYARPIITLSYIEPEAINVLEDMNLLNEGTYEKTMGILKDAPSDGPFFPKAYDVKQRKYMYDKDINLIDQSLVALYRAKSGYPTKKYASFIKKEFAKNGVIFGKYNRITGEPSVDYESPAIYGWLILFCVEIGENELAKGLFKEMVKFQSKDSDYYGGYSVYYDDTHIFDNLVPLLAERKLYDTGILE
ncbi:glycosyl hydrolase family 8 [Bacillus tuaregi]|uniref:glycosyl hydrolase family 8 n=1 Tax=Bacillus tuaregi TaxID=1816695 RepID=UPI0013567136|nr:glycosyl hydrolase family 8 [Bacillus tuaregi]